MPSGYIYLKQRTTPTKCKTIFKVKVADMDWAEGKAHKRFSDYNEPLSNKNHRNKIWLKIGYSVDPKRRVKEINASGLEDGKNEWFYIPKKELREVKNYLRSLSVQPSTKEKRFGKAALWIAAASIFLFFAIRGTVKQPDKAEKNGRWTVYVKDQWNRSKNNKNGLDGK